MEQIAIVSQAFYGNRVGTAITEEELDNFVLGYLDANIKPTTTIDRTIIRLPIDKDIAIVYNKYAEMRSLKDKEETLREYNYEMSPLAVIPELNIKLYSRCIACRVDENNKPMSLKSGDFDKIIKYFAE